MTADQLTALITAIAALVGSLGAVVAALKAHGTANAAANDAASAIVAVRSHIANGPHLPEGKTDDVPQG